MKRHIFITLLSVFLLAPNVGLASSLFVNPVSGTFSVGSTFDVSILLDTQGKSINALQVYLQFPPDKLQVVSPSTGRSIVDVWTVPPKYDNNSGQIDLEGGIPGGIIASRGVLTTITFRVKSIGDARIKFLDKSKIYLNDGLATEDLSQTGNVVYNLILPAPQGPIVTSETHPNQSIWYPNSTAVLHFGGDSSVEGYSYILNKDLNTVPDNINKGNKRSVTYTNLADGVYYFHIKALRGGVWGGTTHFVFRVDTTPPANFPIEVLPSSRTTSTKPVFQFSTTDASSGLDHYELKIEPLSVSEVQQSPDGAKNFFIETTSPYITSHLNVGYYDIIVRAYDKAGNYQEVTKHFSITTPLFKFIGEKGLEITDGKVLPWKWFWILCAALLALLGFGAHKAWVWRYNITKIHKNKELPEDILNKLEELKKYRNKYGSKIIAALFLAFSLFTFHPVSADSTQITPPLITILSKDISNKDIFYAGGRTDVTNETVILYFQNLQTGETTSEDIQSDKNGNWFYRHDSFLAPGDYILWTQGKVGEQMSPPSATTQMFVKRSALEFGSNRLSYETIYLIIVIILFFGILGLGVFMMYHYYHGRKKHKAFQREIKETEESIRRGFAVLRRDIESELELVRKSNPGNMSFEEKQKEAQLLLDLNNVQKHIGKEVWELKKESW